jgi:hypothetical protein
MKAIERERFVQVVGRPRGPAGKADQWVLRVVQKELLGGSPNELIEVRAWHPPWDGDSWPEYHLRPDLEPAPVRPRSADDVDILPRGELMALLEQIAARPNLPDWLSASDLDLMAELPTRWRRSPGNVASQEWLAATKIAKRMTEAAEQERVAAPMLSIMQAVLDPVAALRELKQLQEVARRARRDWVAELWMAQTVRRRPSVDARRERAIARKFARAAHRAYLASIQAE